MRIFYFSHYYTPEGEYAWTMERPYSEQDAKQFFGDGRNRPHEKFRHAMNHRRRAHDASLGLLDNRARGTGGRVDASGAGRVTLKIGQV